MEQVVHLAWRKAGAKAGAPTMIRFESGMVTKNGSVRFEKTIKWLTPSKDWHGEKIVTCGQAFYSSIYMSVTIESLNTIKNCRGWQQH